MTHDNDLIRRGDALDVTDDYEFKAFIRALPAVAASQDADADLLFDAYKGLLVLHRILDKHGLIVGAETTNKLADRIVAAHPEFPPRTALRSAVAASQPADTVRVVVKPLDLSYVMRHAFLSGVVAANEIPAGDPCIGPDLWLDYDPRPNPALDRILAALDVQPDPRDAQIAALVEKLHETLNAIDGYNRTLPDEDGIYWDRSDLITQEIMSARAALDVQPDPRDAQIARLVDAVKALEMWDAARGYPVPYRVRDPLRAALAAVKGENK